MDPITTIGAGLAVIGSKDILVKVLGPTADYVGGEVQGFVKKCNINIDQIFVKAKNKLGDRLDNEGGVSPRVLKSVLDEGRFCEDELAAEYYGGVLASSKVEGSRDDRGVAHMEIIKSMSVYQLRLHYLFYSLLKEHGEAGSRIGTQSERLNNKIFIPFSVYTHAMEFLATESPEVVLTHAVAGLVTNGLIDGHYQFGSKEHMQSVYKNCPEEGGIMLVPTILGAELFLWAEGINSINSANLLTEKFTRPEPIIPIIDGSTKI
ncbi:hypothetical protein [Microbulbifer sp. TRSA007]|uniref:hypothetical protein n=1 Tax=Microbulbifer sp. TRSA007 TaxID=3243384 RepID=UPI00403A2FE5